MTGNGYPHCSKCATHVGDEFGLCTACNAVFHRACGDRCPACPSTPVLVDVHVRPHLLDELILIGAVVALLFGALTGYAFSPTVYRDDVRRGSAAFCTAR